LVAGILIVAASAAANPFIEDSLLRDRISGPLALDLLDARPNDILTCLVILESPPLLALTEEIPIPQRIEHYRFHSFGMQTNVLDEMNDEIPGSIDLLDRHWLPNCMEVQGKPADLQRLARKKKIKKLVRSGGIRLIEPSRGSADWPEGETSPWNIVGVGAADGWAAGYTGKGVVIGHLDTGVDVSHPALAGKFAGHWFDAVKGQEQPYDDHGHGTHTLGTLLGGDGLGPWPNDTGVAPGATWVGAKILDEHGVGTYKQCLAGLEFLAELKSEVDIRVICGSWSLDDQGEDLLVDVCRILLELDILPIFAVGNDGPAPQTVDVPGSYPSVLGVGALDREGRPAGFSSRGPVPDAPWLDGIMPLDPDWLGHKPDLAAPGVDILSCGTNRDYTLMSGTSMAAPHVAGAAALLLDKNSSLTSRDLAITMLQTTQRVPGVGQAPENICGWGALDISRALAAVEPEGSGNATMSSAGSSGGLSLEVSKQGDGTRIRFTAETGDQARLDVYDLAGRRVRSLPVSQSAGSQDVIWREDDASGRPLTSGVYLVKLGNTRHSVARTWVVIR